MKEEKKLFVMTWTKEQVEESEDFLQEALEMAAGRIGIYAITNPDESIQWIGNQLTENEKANTISLFVSVITRYEGEK